MAFENSVTTVSLVAGEDLSSSQYLAVGPDASMNAMKSDGAGPLFDLGILQNKPQSGEAASIAIYGLCKAKAAGTITAGDRLKADGSTGAVTTQSSGESIGRAMEAATAAGQIITIFLMGGHT